VPALPSSVIDPIWDQFAALLPEREVAHPLGCHRPRIPDRIVLDKLIQVLVLGAAYNKIADSSCSATTIRTRRDEWIAAGDARLLLGRARQAVAAVLDVQLADRPAAVLAPSGCHYNPPPQLQGFSRNLRLSPSDFLPGSVRTATKHG